MNDEREKLEAKYKYRSTAIVKAGELLLQPHDALHFLDELERAGTLIFGVDVWHYVNDEIAEDPGCLDLSESIDPHINAAAARDFIEKHLREGTAFVSLVY